MKEMYRYSRQGEVGGKIKVCIQNEYLGGWRNSNNTRKYELEQNLVLYVLRKMRRLSQLTERRLKNLEKQKHRSVID